MEKDRHKIISRAGAEPGRYWNPCSTGRAFVTLACRAHKHSGQGRQGMKSLGRRSSDQDCTCRGPSARPGPRIPFRFCKNNTGLVGQLGLDPQSKVGLH